MKNIEELPHFDVSEKTLLRWSVDGCPWLGGKKLSLKRFQLPDGTWEATWLESDLNAAAAAHMAAAAFVMGIPIEEVALAITQDNPNNNAQHIAQRVVFGNQRKRRRPWTKGR